MMKSLKKKINKWLPIIVLGSSHEIERVDESVRSLELLLRRRIRFSNVVH